MPEARDRIERPVDYAAIFANRRRHGVLLDEPATRLSVFESPVERSPEPESVGLRSLVDGTSRIVRGDFSSWRTGYGRGHSPYRVSQERENVARRGRGRSSPSPLPSWYPRTPLRDITHIMRAIERRRGAGLGVEGDGREIETPTRQQVAVLETPVQLAGERNFSMVTPVPFEGFKRGKPSTARVHKMLLDISKETSEEVEEAGFITPQKKLLNSIDKVEKIVMEEIQKLNSTPLAKRVERERKVKTLMSMR